MEESPSSEVNSIQLSQSRIAIQLCNQKFHYQVFKTVGCSGPKTTTI
jgi:hypothetical protein